MAKAHMCGTHNQRLPCLACDVKKARERLREEAATEQEILREERLFHAASAITAHLAGNPHVHMSSDAIALEAVRQAKALLDALAQEMHGGVG